MKTRHIVAIDLGATSGRVILSTLKDGIIDNQEIHRFPNSIMEKEGRFHWNIYSLFDEIKIGLKAISSIGVKIDSIGVDTWGVDFVYVGEDGNFLDLPRAYRDPYTAGAPEKYFEKIPRAEVYQRTGIQIMGINSLFQLYAANLEGYAPLKKAKRILFMPDAIAYMLTGEMVCEYTILSTSQFMNPNTKAIDSQLLEAAGVSTDLFPKVVFPGEIVGRLKSKIAAECNLSQDIPVIAVAGHDTGSAVAAIPAENGNFAFLSSGTWSLMGIVVDKPIISEHSFNLNFTNEGGVGGKILFLKNITGMWILEQCRKEWEQQGKHYTHETIASMYREATPTAIVDVDAPDFANPQSMSKAIAEYCIAHGNEAPQDDKEVVRCIFDSLVDKYKQTLSSLREFAPFPIERLHIIGGGSKNLLLNDLTSKATGITVIAGPAEATACGNIMVQNKALDTNN